MWQVILTPEAEKNLKKLPYNIQERVKTALKELRNNPFYGKPLRGNLAGRFSARVGDYRIVYRQKSEQHEIWILYIRHRREAY